MLFINITNHGLTADQIADAKNRFGVEEFFELPSELKARWAAVPTVAEVEELQASTNPGNFVDPVEALCWDVAKWVAGVTKTPSARVVALIQGDLGAVIRTAQMLKNGHFFSNVADKLDIEFVYATTRRESVETVQQDGSVVKTNVFKHAGFRNILPNTF